MLREGCNDFVAVSDSAVGPTMRLLASGYYDDRRVDGKNAGHVPRIISGPSAVAGLATLLSAGARPDLRSALGLSTSSRVVVVVCEGATNDDEFRRLVGCRAGELRELGALE